ncbi:TetR/AcrR family transcriptional regulator [Kitasatospora sp. NPDC057541]|uniref:TetR/AcrR family transcriptional regulator n=1 Tax=unclassified Kitasatospora TaxID=2633591 RepID=UPI0036737043
MGMKRGTYRTGRERVERILDAAHELFVDPGYRATSLRAIASASGISHPALLRHFSSKAEILTALVERLDRQYLESVTDGPDGGFRPRPAAETARRNEATPGWIPLFTTLLGEATSPEHPGRALMRDRRREAIAIGVRTYGALGADERSAKLAVQRLVAAWEGLQILSLYFPGRIDIPARIAAHEDDVRINGIAPAPPARPGASTAAHAPAADPAPERTPRERALYSACVLYARHGYSGTSMQAVADDAGLTKAALVHLAPTKAALLDLVLAYLATPALDWNGPGGRLRAALDRPRWQAAAEIVLMCEAIAPSHPAHRSMAELLEEGLSGVEEVLRATGGASDAEAEAAAQWIVALVLGAVIASLYEPEDVEPAALVESALPPRAPACAPAALAR